MQTSVANFSDVLAMTKFARLMHDKSSWKHLEFNPTHVRKNLMAAVRTEGTDAIVAKDSEGKVVGLLIAAVDQFFISKDLYATDVHFMCESGGIQIMAEFKRWAKKHGARHIIMGIANDDPEGRTARFYEMLGMRAIGDAWVMDLDDKQERAA